MVAISHKLQLQGFYRGNGDKSNNSAIMQNQKCTTETVYMVKAYNKFEHVLRNTNMVNIALQGKNVQKQITMSDQHSAITYQRIV